MSFAQSIPDNLEPSFKEVGETAGRSISLDLLSPGTHARVLSIGGSGPVARRLMEMGVVPGAPVRVVKFAPLGDPLEIRVRDYHLALRRNEAQTISVVISDKEKP